MNALVPRGYGSFPAVQFGFPNQSAYAYGSSGYARQGGSFAPRYSSQGFYAPNFNPMNNYPVMGVNQMKKPSFGEQLISAYNDLDRQYRHEQYLKQVQAMQKQYWKGQANIMPLPVAGLQRAPLTTDVNEVFNVIRETRYVPYPVVLNQGGGSGSGFGDGPNLGFGGGGGGMNLTPKVRVIFIPTGQSSLQQPCAGPLTMPPFLYNRISQPFYSFPLPPPLPQLGSLPLTPAVQQMVMERYSNPVAVLPFTPNWQMPSTMMSGCPQIAPQQQPYVDPVSTFQPYPATAQSYYYPQLPAVPSYSSAPQSYIAAPPPPSYQSYPPAPQSYLPAPAPIAPSYPPAPQSYLPAPAPIAPSYPPAPQSYFPAPAPTAPSYPPAPQSYFPAPAPTASYPPAPQSYIAPPTNILASSYIPPPPSYQPPFTNTHEVSSGPQYAHSGYPGTCRACPPAPPSLNLPVTGYCWVQHCAACHHVPISHPNTRPAGGRITPLLRHPTVPQYVPDQTDPQQQYHHANAPVMIRPWLRKTPPLPPGAVLISDEYVDRNGSRSRYDYSHRKQEKYSRNSGSKRRSKTVESSTTSTTSSSSARNGKKTSHRRSNQSNDNPTQQQQQIIQPKNSTLLSQLSTSSSGLSVEYQKTSLQRQQQPSSKNGPIPRQVANEARNINLQYNYRPQELSSVYLINRFLKSGSETNSLSSNRDTASNPSPTLAKVRSQTSLSSTDLGSIHEESNIKFDNQQSNLFPSSSSGKPKEKLVIIREFMTASPSTLSTVSSNMTFSVIGKDIDSISMTSTIRGNRLDEEDLLESEIF